MSRLSDLIMQEELSTSERNEVRDLVEFLEQVVRDVGGTIVGENQFNQLRSHRVNMDNSGITVHGTGTSASDPDLRAVRLVHRDFDEHFSLNLYDKVGDNLGSGVTLRAPNPGGSAAGFPSLNWTMQWDDTNTDEYLHQWPITPTSGNSARLEFRLLDGGGSTQIEISLVTSGDYAEGQGYDRRFDLGAAYILKQDGGALNIENETSGSAIHINNDRIDVDFIVQGDTETSLLGVDAGLDLPFVNKQKTDTGDPTGREGGIYINTFDNVARIYADGAWRTIASW